MNRIPLECWCGAEQAVRRGRVRLEDGEEFTLVQCPKCGMWSLFPMPSDELLLKYYSAEYYGASRKKFVGPLANLVGWFQRGRSRFIHRICPPPARILDVGCGNGGFLMQCRDFGYDVEGTEWTGEAARRVPPQSGVKVHTGDLLSINFPDEYFDVVTLWHVFEHLRDPYEVAGEIQRILRKGGHLVLSLPNMESYQARRFGTDWFHLDPPRHLHGFGPKSLGRMLRTQGFEVQSVSTFSLEQNPYGVIQSALNARGFLRDRAYSVLKGTSESPLSVRLMDLSLLGILTPAGLIYSLWEAALGHGGTMTLHARKSKNP